MHQFCYIYITAGRELAVTISNFVNKSRYSTSLKPVSTPIIDITLFSASLPVTLIPTHLELAQSFARSNKTLQKSKIFFSVWVYDVLVEGSPFISNADA